MPKRDHVQNHLSLNGQAAALLLVTLLIPQVRASANAGKAINERNRLDREVDEL